MERFSNNYSDFYKEAKVKLSALDLTVNEICIVRYLEMPCLSDGQYSLFLVRNDLSQTYKLIEKTWDRTSEPDRFSTGIFNLDRIYIKTEVFPVSAQKQREFEKIIQGISFVPETLESQDHTLIDGVEYELTINTDIIDKSYKWKIATDDYKYFEPLITFIKTIKTNVRTI